MTGTALTDEQRDAVRERNRVRGAGTFEKLSTYEEIAIDDIDALLADNDRLQKNVEASEAYAAYQEKCAASFKAVVEAARKLLFHDEAADTREGLPHCAEFLLLKHRLGALGDDDGT